MWDGINSKSSHPRGCCTVCRRARLCISRIHFVRRLRRRQWPVATMAGGFRQLFSGIIWSGGSFLPQKPGGFGLRNLAIFVRSNMLTKRIIACLDVNGGRVVKGVQFENLRDAGDPAELAKAHSASGADEIVLLDISAAHERRATLLDTVRRAAQQLFIPFTVGGGIRTLEDAAAVFWRARTRSASIPGRWPIQI